MAGKKQVMDMRSTTSGVSSQESDEQQRNWTKRRNRQTLWSAYSR